MLDSREGVCAGQARFEYPATSALFSIGETTTRRWAMRRILLVVTAVLLVLVLSFALTGCRKSSGKKGGGYLPTPTSTVPTAVA
jgi:predicted small lipoprotein YifL